MSKLVIPIILSVVIMIAGVFAFIPVEKASTVHGSLGALTILSLEKTLLKDPECCVSLGGPDVTWTLTAITDVEVLGFIHDNTPTLGAGFCTLDDHHGPRITAVHCDEASYRLLDVVIDGSKFKPEALPDAANSSSDHLSISQFADSLTDCCSPIDVRDDKIPILKAGEEMVVTFDALTELNDVRINVSFAVKGDAKLT